MLKVGRQPWTAARFAVMKAVTKASTVAALGDMATILNVSVVIARGHI